MPTQEQVSQIVQEVGERLKQEGAGLRVAGEKLEDDWLYVVITPARKGVRASDHARLMSQIERQLREEGKDHVLLVPALED